MLNYVVPATQKPFQLPLLDVEEYVMILKSLKTVDVQKIHKKEIGQKSLKLYYFEPP